MSIDHALSIQNATEALQDIAAALSNRIKENSSYSAVWTSDDESGDESEPPIFDFFDKVENDNTVLRMSNFTTSEFHELYGTF